MKRFIQGMLMFMVIGVLIANVQAGPLQTDITMIVGDNFCTDTLNTAPVHAIYGTITGSPGKEGYFLSVYMIDSVAAAAAADSIIFRLVRRPQDAGSLDSANSPVITANPNGWITVYSFALTQLIANNFPLSKHIPLDSLAVYPLTPGGEYGWLVVGSISTASHYFTKAFKFRTYIEHRGAF